MSPDNTCWSCKGAGELPCNKCGGAGRYPCPGCGASGFRGQTWEQAIGDYGPFGERFRAPKICNMCEGTGQATCNRCHGTGFMMCLRCGGTGRVEVRQRESSAPRSTGRPQTSSSTSGFTDMILTCVDCKRSYSWTAGEQDFYHKKGMSAPKRCPECRQKKKQGR
jgi:hypothetical protein